MPVPTVRMFGSKIMSSRRKADFVARECRRRVCRCEVLSLERVGLALFVEGHHDDRRAVAQNFARLFAEFRLAFLERNGIHDAFALNAFQAGFDDFPFRGIHHERHFGDLRFAAEQLQEARHGGDAVNHPFVHADVDDVARRSRPAGARWRRLPRICLP